MRCVPAGPSRPQTGPGVLEIEWLFTKDFAPWPAFRDEALRKARAVGAALSSGRHNVLFWCNHGRHQSAAALACFLIWCNDYDPDLIMSKIRGRRSIVQPDAQPCCQEGLLAGLQGRP